MNTNKSQQIEMSFNGVNRNLRQARQNRARWWFNQMRAVVDSVTEWRPSSTPPPQQTYLTLAQGK